VTSGQFPMLSVAMDYEKGFRDRLLPLTPDFAAFVLRVPESRRTGFVFNPVGERGRAVRGDDYVGGIISEIGKASKVIVDHRKQKYASAHDLRRSFGSRWARRVMPQTLKDLMRHADIATTMKYYVDLNADETASDLWKNFGGQQNGQQ
jgi:integrase